MKQYEQSFVRPADPGRRIHFRGREEPLAEAGEWVPMDDYWQRRMAEGRVLACSPPEGKPQAGDVVTELPELGKRRGRKPAARNDAERQPE